MTTTADTSAAKLLREYQPTHWQGALQGATFEGRRLVLAGSAYLLRIVPDNGRVVDRLETFPSAGGLAYDGHHLWQRSDDCLEQLETRTGFVVQSVPTDFEEVTGLECVEGHLLVLHSAGRVLARIRVVSHGLEKEAIILGEAETGASLHGLAWARGELWSSTAGELVRIDPDSARSLDRLPLPKPMEVRDIAADAHGRFWCVDGRSGMVRVCARPGWVESAGAAHPLVEARPSSLVSDVPAPAHPAEHPGETRAAEYAPAVKATFDRILVPIDFSQSFRWALGTALLLQERFGSEVHLVHLAEQGANAEFLAGAGALVGYGDIAQDAKRSLLQFVEDIFPGRGKDVRAHVHVAHDLVDVIRRTARGIDATLVVLTEGPHHQGLSTSKVDRIARDVKQERAVMVVSTTAARRQGQSGNP